MLCASKRVVKWSRDVTLVQAFSHVWWLMLPGINSRILWSRKRQGDYLAHPWPCASRILYYLIFFYAYKADEAPLQDKANAVLYCNWNWKSFGREELKRREREATRLSSSSGLPSPNCYFCGHFLAKMPLLFPPTQPLLSRHTASHTRAHKKNDPGFTSLTASQSFL